MPERAADKQAALLAELWYAERPELGDPRLLDALQAEFPEAQLQQDSISIPHPTSTTEANGRSVPLLTVVMPGTPLGEQGKQPPDPSQTWDWAGAEEAVARCRWSVLVTEMFADPASRTERVAALTSVLAVLIEQTVPELLSWPYSQRVVDPDGFQPDDIDSVINVRFFSVGEEGNEMVMDTAGLSVLDLPDVQCHYRDANPAEIAAMLFSTARYIFEHGDVIDDGHTISGLRGDERFSCRHELALVGPSRRVIDVDLGDPYAAGSRQGDPAQ